MAKRIVVVEDTPEILRLFHDILTDEGYVVDGFDTPQAALAQIGQQCPDLLIVDYLLAGSITGLDLVQVLKGQPATAGIPILVCTAAAPLAQDVASYVATGEVVVVLKPFDLDTLVALVAQLIGPAM